MERRKGGKEGKEGRSMRRFRTKGRKQTKHKGKENIVRNYKRKERNTISSEEKRQMNTGKKVRK